MTLDEQGEWGTHAHHPRALAGLQRAYSLPFSSLYRDGEGVLLACLYE